jgi:hypothetical protein
VIRRGWTGSGLTRKLTIGWDSAEDENDPQVRSLLECATLEGLIEQIERECFAIMAEADLPTWYGSYTFDQTGTLRKLQEGDTFGGLTVANELWPLAKARGYAWRHLQPRWRSY